MGKEFDTEPLNWSQKRGLRLYTFFILFYIFPIGGIMPIKIFLAFTAFILVGCANYQVPLCNEENRRDIPNLEGRFSVKFALPVKDKSKVIRQFTSFTRLSRGHYYMEEKKGRELHTCELDGNMYVEMTSDSVPAEHNAYTAYRFARNGDGSFDFVLLGLDTDILDARGIPYQVIGMDDAQDKKNDGGLDSKEGRLTLNVTNVFLVNNKGLDPEDFVQMLDPVSVKITFAPER